jgi:hypothetical protein
MILENFGFRVVRQKGSHVIMMNEEKTRNIARAFEFEFYNREWRKEKINIV